MSTSETRFRVSPELGLGMWRAVPRGGKKPRLDARERRDGMTQVLAHAVWNLLPLGQGIHVRVTTANAGWAGSPAKAAWQLRQKHLKYGPTRQQLEGPA